MKRAILLTIAIACVFSCKKKEEKKSVSRETISINTAHNIHLSSGTIQRIDSFPSKHVVPRTVDIWLPDGYTSDKKYEVLYMHDGQMLFDATTTWNKQEWKVDEHAGNLQKQYKTKDFIVVAVHNISRIRWNDYFPKKAFQFIPKTAQGSLKAVVKQWNFDMTMNADNYLKFLVEEVKPYIDTHFSVFTERNHTSIAGSSMGGLISMYAVCEYPNIFGAAACISTHWPGVKPYKGNPVPAAFFAYMEEKVPSAKTHRFYFDFGTETLDQYYPQYEENVNRIFKEKGYDATNFVNRKFEGADHSENSWNLRLEIPLLFLLNK
jgi:predicted peptidase